MSNEVIIVILTGFFGLLAAVITSIIAPITLKIIEPFIEPFSKLIRKLIRGGLPRLLNRSKVVRWLVVMGLVIGAFLAYLVAVNNIRPNCLPLAPTDVTITSPAPGSPVSLKTSVQGTACHIPNNQKLWIFVVPVAAFAYFPQVGPATVDRAGNWSASAVIGRPSDVDQGFEVVSVLADQGTSNIIDRYFKQAASFQTLPDGTQVMSQVHVIRT